jgi:FemAB-related protein (PEP-CTERM system-associated)
MSVPDLARRQTVAEGDGASAVTVACDVDSARWDAFVLEHDYATGYHEWGWRRVFERAFHHEPVYLVAHRGGGVVGILPLVHIKSFLFGRTLTSLPFLNYAGVIAESNGVAHELLEAAGAIASRLRCRHIELRHRARQFPDLPCRQHKVAMLLPLGEHMWERLDRKVRNQIRKAQKSGLTEECGGADLLQDFYAVFARNMRDLGTPVYSRRFFHEVVQTFPERTRLHVVRVEGRPVAAALTYRTRTTIEVPWASSVRDYNSMCPNHLLYWSIIEFAVRGGCDVLDFGRSTPNEGTYNFKAQWGALPVTLHWEYPLTKDGVMPDATPANPKFRIAIELWKKLPLSLATRLGPRIVRSIP